MAIAAAKDRTRELQRTLYRAAKADPRRRFHALHDKVHRRDVLERAWRQVRANRGAAGIDWQTIEHVERYGVTRLLDELAADLGSGGYRALPARRVFIPKPGSAERRPLSIPAVRDRIVQAAVKIVIEPIFEADFQPCSFGFRPRRAAHDALQVLIDECWRGRRWVVETDIASCLEPSSHCHRVHGGGVEEAFVGRNSDSQALSAAAADVDGFQFAALDTLQHGLAGDAEGAHGVDDRHEAGGGIFDEPCAELVVDADAPGGAGRVLLAGDEPVVEPAVQGGRSDAEGLGGLGDRQQLTVGWFGGRLVGGDAAVAAKASDDDRGEPLAGGGAPALAVEDPGDRGVVVMDGEAVEE